MNHHRRPPFEPPTPNSIHQGIISRIESFGAFVKLADSPISGLVHISQLHSSKVDNVTDVVELDMHVHVKVMEVTVDSYEDENGRQRQRHRVKLSMKYVDQDTGRDLDPDNTQMEQDLFRSGGNKARSVGEGGTGGADSTLGRALASNIGMSSAIDPGNLILKGKQKGVGASFNGYALVGEEEGEDEVEGNRMNNVATSNVPPSLTASVRPMGRGRGTTLPAWMTRSDGGDKLGSMKETTHDMEDDTDNDSHRKSKKNHKHKKERRSKHHKRHKKHRDREGRRRDRSVSSSRSRSRSRDRKRSYKSSRSRKDDRHRSKSRSRSRDDRCRDKRSPSRDHVHNKSHASEFASVEEAKAIIERFERQKKDT